MPRFGSARRKGHRVASIVTALAVALGVAFAAVPTSIAQTDADAFRDLATAPDFRMRVAAALALGKSTSTGARFALERALGDAEPSVRAAASAALGALGSGAALPALRAALARETTVTVRAQLESTLAKLGGPTAPAVATRFLVTLGKIENKAGASGTAVAPAFKAAARTRVGQIPGVELLDDGADVSAAGKSRNLPAFTVDGSLMTLAKKDAPGGVAFAARVEFLIRKMPGQTLKGTMSGNAQAVADHSEIRGVAQLSQLQVDAVAGAIDSALKGAAPVLETAAR